MCQEKNVIMGEICGQKHSQQSGGIQERKLINKAPMA